ncbi:hypothetical protein [Pseudofrankia asymbiotica]|uniref:Uncharacterized protein n=1 Tax=Pseudofrankia asymbiotica TaxID=1834516 RepID=A0A1V2IKA8_9ACTN|nr:hypothetical protein [Pseudofrankia asymbiotica]ONH33642.1 hypothetical protein BL253_01085 [Pseudofrankia asymbiotica]
MTTTDLLPLQRGHYRCTCGCEIRIDQGGQAEVTCAGCGTTWTDASLGDPVSGPLVCRTCRGTSTGSHGAPCVPCGVPRRTPVGAEPAPAEAWRAPSRPGPSIERALAPADVDIEVPEPAAGVLTGPGGFWPGGSDQD